MTKSGQTVQRFVSYLRVSTTGQGRSGLGLEAQRAAVAQHVASVGGRIVVELVEVESGKRSSNRPQLAAALSACRKHRAVLVIAKLDRLARNVAFISGLMESKVEFIACDMPSASKLTVHILAAVAEEEARMISARTKAALDAARARGVKLGGKRDNAGDLRPHAKQGAAASAVARAEKAQARAADLETEFAELAAAGVVTLKGIADALNERGIAAPRGGHWSAVQVSRVIALIEKAKPLDHAKLAEQMEGYGAWA